MHVSGQIKCTHPCSEFAESQTSRQSQYFIVVGDLNSLQIDPVHSDHQCGVIFVRNTVRVYERGDDISKVQGAVRKGTMDIGGDADQIHAIDLCRIPEKSELVDVHAQL